MAARSILSEARKANEAFNNETLALARQVSELQGLCMLCGSGSDNEMVEGLAAMADKARRVDRKLTQLENDIDHELETAETAHRLLQELKHEETRASELVRIYEIDTCPKPEDSITQEEECADPTENASNNDGRDESDGAEETQEPLDHFASQKDADGNYTIDTPGENRLNKVPKYMRGRLTLSKLEAACNAVNKALQFKQATMAIPRGKQSVAVRERIMEWRNQESDETRGLFFVTIEDVISHKEVDINSLKSALQVLRFLGVLRLVNDGGIARYCVAA
mmetsp:Transcript_12528/g.22330  ORF Transcript_12528/g.22330 Transcript_12528/m.22330 type:complete len:280 (-) Transcript_12528:441-1280(-)|eukprot:CAMPEP_0184526398 /NCGR_PEP_ID=MMETSP0198_2-20121128/10633_1 /TAXON_ID=1112570 /ORGANISM="Thraustochytrium sp., Strain LLF1b" /LENGTH=279 /DNA_ID=CAMNT_0026917967 /DNA_START=382 /DNA_END=1221 /DNA_ORIENTATION=-